MSGGLADDLEAFMRLYGDDPTGEFDKYRQQEADRRTLELMEVVDAHKNSHVTKTIANIERQSNEQETSKA